MSPLSTGSNYRAWLQSHRLLFAFALFTALLLRLWIALHFAHEAGDTPGYDALAENMLRYHVFSWDSPESLSPTDARAPGYPLFLAAIYTLAGMKNHTAVRVTEAILDTSLLFWITWLAWEIFPASAGVVLILAALQPFTAEYTAAVLTETCTIVLATIALLTMLIGYKHRSLKAWFFCGMAIAVAILCRPDCIMLIASAAVLLLALIRRSEGVKKSSTLEACAPKPSEPRSPEGVKKSEPRPLGSGPSDESPLAYARGSVFSRTTAIRAALFFAAGLALPWGPWVARNAITLHRFQPLADFYASQPDEFTPVGFIGWTRTWIKDDLYLDSVSWQVNEGKLDMHNFPAYAFDSEEERSRVEALIMRYNEEDEMTREIDREFAHIAQERIERHPLRYLIQLPFRRALMLWFSPHYRIFPLTEELLPLRNLIDDPLESVLVDLFFLSKLALVVLACVAVILLPDRLISLWAALTILLRTAAFSWMPNVEYRYVLEVFPLLLVLGATGFLLLRMRKQP
ncbi:MAG TPA: glycosyltransferase family 39 protein [Acidobacteriota bacterium]|jgi:hypothetical protein|nr:glycosyltransferase family 39 protein [Acidobacteriota bacterium]